MSKITIDADKCKGCALCVDVCPRKCIEISDTFNKTGYHPAIPVNEKNCTGCGFCYLTCPDVCIEVNRNVK